MRLISNIQQLRENKRFSRPQLAERVDVSWETIKAYEVKGAYPSIHVAFKMAKALECRVDDLFTIEDDNGETIAVVGDEESEKKEHDDSFDALFYIAQSLNE
jgi:DNA-binding XRE family transcriptional regulator